MLDIGVRWGLFGDDLKPLREDWVKLRSRLYDANDLRNRLAHSELSEEYFLHGRGVRVHAAPAHVRLEQSGSRAPGKGGKGA